MSNIWWHFDKTEYRSVYTLVNTPGLTEEIWLGGQNAAPHANVDSIFNWPATSPLWLPSHTNWAPDQINIETDWDATNWTNPATDQTRYRWWIYIEENGTQLRDINGNTWEKHRIRLWSCWSNPTIVLLDNTDSWTWTAWANSNQTFATVNQGWHFIAFDITDLTVQAWVQLQISTDGTTWANFVWETSSTEPYYECRQEDSCYELQTNESFCPPLCSSWGQAISQWWSSSLTTTTELIEYERYRGRSATGTTVQHVDNATMTRTAVGRWQVRFTWWTHPNGESYTPHLTIYEDAVNRDVAKVWVVEWTQNASWFDVWITVDDNWAAADQRTDRGRSRGVESPINVITSVALV